MNGSSPYKESYGNKSKCERLIRNHECGPSQCWGEKNKTSFAKWFIFNFFAVSKKDENREDHKPPFLLHMKRNHKEVRVWVQFLTSDECAIYEWFLVLYDFP